MSNDVNLWLYSNFASNLCYFDHLSIVSKLTRHIYRVVGNWWYKPKGDSTRKNKSKIKNKNFSFEALFSRKSTLNFGSVRVHFIASRYNGSHW